jgi:hypothetical protein
MAVGVHSPPPGPRDALPVESVGDEARGLAGGLVGEDASDHARLLLIDVEESALIVRAGRNRIAVATAALGGEKLAAAVSFHL